MVKNRALLCVCVCFVFLTLAANRSSAQPLGFADQFQAAENLYKAGKFKEAAVAYLKVARMKRPASVPIPRYANVRGQAALQAVHSLMKYRNTLLSAALTKTVPVPRKKVCAVRKGRRCIRYKPVSFCVPRPLGPDVKLLIDAFGVYATVGPQGKYVPTVLYNRGFLHLTHGHCKKALSDFVKVLTKHQDAVEVERAAVFRAGAILLFLGRKKEFVRLADRVSASKKLGADPRYREWSKRIRLNIMWEDADNLRRQRKYAKCGEMFEDIIRLAPKNPRAPDMYWNAAMCYESARMLDKTVALRLELRKKFPKHRHSMLALYYVAGNFHGTCQFERAAAMYEKFARDYPRRKESPEALKWAISMRGGLGDLRAAERNVRFLTRTYGKYGRRHRKTIAAAQYRLHRYYSLHGKPRKAAGQLERYLKKYALAGGWHRRLEALTMLGDYYYRRSCRLSFEYGLCGRARRIQVPGKKKRFVTLFAYQERNKGMVRRARVKIAEVVKLTAGGMKRFRLARMPGRTRIEKMKARMRALAATAWASFLMVDLDFEPAMKFKVPGGLDFNPKNHKKMRASQRKFSKWVMQRFKEAQQLVRRYREVILFKNAEWAIASTARIGMIYHAFADAILTVPTPRHLKKPEQRDAYRAEMAKYANPLLDKARFAYRVCLKTAERMRWYDKWSRLCSLRLNILDPARFPLVNELRPAADKVPAAPFPGCMIRKKPSR